MPFDRKVVLWLLGACVAANADSASCPADGGDCQAPADSSTATGHVKCKPVVETLSLLCQDAATNDWRQVPWLNGWAYNAEFLSQAADLVRSGRLVRITDALSSEAASALHAEVWELKWTREVKALESIQFARHLANCSEVQRLPYFGECSPLLDTFHLFLMRELRFWSQFTKSTLTSWNRTSAATWYKASDFISPHNDDGVQRLLTLTLSLTKDWQPNWGGTFWWIRDRPEHYPPSYNVLYLFQPMHNSHHLVSPVMYGDEDKRRLAISGWFHAEATGPVVAT
eukprot:TRINITY_DN42841_c0_g1_i1.p1 TRINITY_DN42841_c0_g1~~TRINITY_DN42841_c0_g1_i1.p1  ORF type:complete len:320 (+),score=38.75 TRINITY_DN42841_c0_g1_i1:109-960(+)